jgi:hypothetical protein
MNSASAIGISLGELLSVAVGIVGVLWMLGKIGLSQFMARVDDRFLTIDTKLKTFDSLHGDLARVDKDLVQVRLEMATNFVRQEGLRIMQSRMEQLFKEVFDKLDAKMDKVDCDKVHRQ